MSHQIIRIGTRGSQLALYQARLSAQKIKEKFPEIVIEEVIIKTSGDQSALDSDIPDPFETKRIFTREIEKALLDNKIDLAVHSAKDVATLLPEGLKIAAFLEREDVRDGLLSRGGVRFCDLETGARVGTSSLRRAQQLLFLRPDLKIESIRGNVDTRIKKMQDGKYDAIVLAQAGLNRLGLSLQTAEVFDPHQFIPAPGQGAILLQTRSSDALLNSQLKELDHQVTHNQLLCERAFLRQLEGGCQLPCGIYTTVEGSEISARGALLAIGGREKIEEIQKGNISEAEEVGVLLAQKILKAGGQEILENIRRMKRDHD